jgi:hypothetical protein
MLEHKALIGSTTPRLFTRPLVTGRSGPCGCGCALTPATSAGFQAVTFATDVAGVELLPWQRWLLIHMLELREDGGFRFRTVLTLISRQNGKSFLLKIVALYFMYMRGRCLVLGAAQDLKIAREAWQGAVELAEGIDELRAEIAPHGVRKANGEQQLTLVNGSRYMISATTRSAGRGLSVDLLLLDELREHRGWESWGALASTTRARPNPVTCAISNAGDEQSIVLNALRATALTGTDDALGLFEWSAPDGCDLDDPAAWVAANPALGYTIGPSVLRSSLVTDPPATFRTESLCQRVDVLDAAVDPLAWADCADRSVPSLAALRARLVACLDVSPDAGHVSLVGAAVRDDGRVQVEPLGAWRSTGEARQALPELLPKIAPATVAWFPAGPAAGMAADLRTTWPEGVEITGADVLEACQGFADLVAARRLIHPDDPMVTAHVQGTSKLPSGDRWRFARRGVAHVDAAYAAAGAVHVARTMPSPPPYVAPEVW